MRVDVETDLKLPIPPLMLPIPSMPPKELEKEVNSTGKGQMIRKVGEKMEDVYNSQTNTNTEFPKFQ